jgi:uncharacterized protein YodC (DUF2158 family)
MGNKFEKGDVVKLKSGGPEMTVSKVKEPGSTYNNRNDDGYQYNCEWFKGASVERSSFDEESLISAKEKKKDE